MARHVLLIEDEPNIAEAIRFLLGREGLTVSSLADGTHAAEAVRTERPDLVILDLMLPGEDGLTLCRNLRARSRLPILMLTARDEDFDQILGLEMGADDYIDVEIVEGENE